MRQWVLRSASARVSFRSSVFRFNRSRGHLNALEGVAPTPTVDRAVIAAGFLVLTSDHHGLEGHGHVPGRLVIGVAHSPRITEFRAPGTPARRSGTGCGSFPTTPASSATSGRGASGPRSGVAGVGFRRGPRQSLVIRRAGGRNSVASPFNQLSPLPRMLRAMRPWGPRVPPRRGFRSGGVFSGSTDLDYSSHVSRGGLRRVSRSASARVSFRR